MTTTIAITIAGIAIVLTLVARGWMDYRAGRGVRYTLIMAAVVIVSTVFGVLVLPHVPKQRSTPDAWLLLAIYGGLAIPFGALAWFAWRRHDTKRARLMVASWAGIASAFMLAWHYLPLPPVR